MYLRLTAAKRNGGRASLTTSNAQFDGEATRDKKLHFILLRSRFGGPNLKEKENKFAG